MAFSLSKRLYSSLPYICLRSVLNVISGILYDLCKLLSDNMSGVVCVWYV